MTKEDLLAKNAQTKASNAYYQMNNQMFNRLLCIILKNISYYLSEILGKRNKDLLEWIIDSTQMLSSTYKLKTRIFWILNDLHDFPSCANCKQQIRRDINSLLLPKYKYCCSKCAHESQEMIYACKNTKLKRYGNPTYNNSQQISQTMQARSSSAKALTRRKFKQSCLEHFGVDNPARCDEVIEKSKSARRIKNNGNYESLETKMKRKQTFIEHYGVDNNMKSNVGKAAWLESVRLKHNDQTLTSTTQLEEVKQKSRDTFKTHMQNESFRNERARKLKMSSDEKFGKDNYMNRELAKKTMIERHGVPFPMMSSESRSKINFEEVHRKANETKRLHGTFNTSRLEEDAFQLLVLRFGNDDIIRQHKTEEYPFYCDFYVKSIDTYIECNFHWTHGKHPFDSSRKEDIEVAASLKEKAKTSKFYGNALNAWTKLDCKKRDVAKMNNLKFFEFFTFKEFKDFCLVQ